MIEPTHRATEHIAARAHRELPGIRIDVQALEDRRQMPIDRALVLHQGTTPTAQLQPIYTGARSNNFRSSASGSETTLGVFEKIFV
jgi:hypothetical protein